VIRFVSEFVRKGYLTSDIDQCGERIVSITDMESKWFNMDASDSD